MTRPLPLDNTPPDPLAAYADGDPEVVRAASPLEPSPAEWAIVRLRVRTRLESENREPASGWVRKAVLHAIVATLFVGGVAALWPTFTPNGPAPIPQPAAVVAVDDAPPKTVALSPQTESVPDLLADFAVLPIARADEVVLYRVPGDGWVPIGTQPLAGNLPLASRNEVEMDEADPQWPILAPGSDSAPLIFATKPR